VARVRNLRSMRAFVAHRPIRAGTIDQAFQKRIAGPSVCAMSSRRRHLPGGIRMGAEISVLEVQAVFIFVAEGARPWAGWGAASLILPLSRTTTRPAEANSMGARRPATPAPMTRKSACEGAHFMAAKW